VFYFTCNHFSGWNYFKIISATLNMLEIFMSCNKPLK